MNSLPPSNRGYVEKGRTVLGDVTTKHAIDRVSLESYRSIQFQPISKEDMSPKVPKSNDAITTTTTMAISSKRRRSDGFRGNDENVPPPTQPRFQGRSGTILTLDLQSPQATRVTDSPKLPEELVSPSSQPPPTRRDSSLFRTPPFIPVDRWKVPQQPNKRLQRPLPDFHKIDTALDQASSSLAHGIYSHVYDQKSKNSSQSPLLLVPSTNTKSSSIMTPIKDCISLSKDSLHYVSTNAFLQVCQVPMTTIYPTVDQSSMTQYYWDETHRSIWASCLDREPIFCPCIDYWDHHPELNEKMRAILLDWLAEVCEDYSLHRETWYLAINYIDRYLMGTKFMPTRKFQLLGVTALFMAAKIEEIYPPAAKEFSGMTDDTYSCKEIMKMEFKILKVLRLTLNATSSHFWMNLYLDNASRRHPLVFQGTRNSSSPYYSERHHQPSSTLRSDFYQSAMSLLEICMIDSRSIHITYSLISAAVFWYLFRHPDGTPDMYTGYTKHQLESYLVWIGQLAKCPVQHVPTGVSKDVRKDEIHFIQLHNKAILQFFETVLRERSQDLPFETQQQDSLLQETISLVSL